MQTHSYDIVVVGGGVIGCAQALALAQDAGISIALLEQNADPFQHWDKNTYHYRVSALTLATQRLLQRLDVWETLLSHRISAFTGMEIWRETPKSSLKLFAHEIGEEQLGFIVENNLLQHVLLTKLLAHPNIDFFDGVVLNEVNLSNNAIVLQSNDGRLFKGKLAIGCDGAQSWMRTQAGIKLDQYDYGQKAIIAHVETSLPHERIARQAFLPTGPLAFLPLASAHHASIVWSLPNAAAQSLLEMDELGFRASLGQAFSGRLGEVNTVSKRHAFPLVRVHAAAYCASRLALVGDAAHVVHPLAGQGVNLGLMDVAALAAVISSAREKGQDIGGRAYLRKYERSRKGDNFFMLSAIDLLQRFFAKENMLLSPLQKNGLAWVDRCLLLKRLFMRYGVGNFNGLPQ